MTMTWIKVLIALLIIAAVAVAIRRRRKRAPLESDSADLTLIKTHIKEVGWHLRLIHGEEEEPSFLYTIGLWETYRHPEILLFATGQDPNAVAGSFRALIKRVIEGERLEAGRVYAKVFAEYDGAVREILPQYFPRYLEMAVLTYDTYDFPAVQLYWPDLEGRFPWQSGFDLQLFPLQPILDQYNVVLANVGYAVVQELIRDEDPEILEKSLGELFFELNEVYRECLLDDWR